MPLSSLLRGLSRTLAVFLFAAITFCSARAHAENRTPDSVLMKNGKIFRGTLELAEVDSSFFKMTLADGKVITIPSSEVVRIERVVPDDPERSITISDERDRDPEPDDTGEAHVLFIADDGVALEERDGTSRSDRWHAVCHGKCEVSLPLDASYRVGGGDVRTSNVFRLGGKDGDHIVLRAKAHSRGAFALGITLVSVGGLAALISLSAMNCQSWDDSCAGQRAGGGIGALISAGVAVLGTVLIANNPSSKVVQTLQPGSGSFLARSTPHSELAHAPIIAAAGPSFAPAARTSTLFTIHF